MEKEIFDKIKKEAKEMLTGINSCHEWEHTERVYNLAMHIGKKENADLEILGLAAILHDIARKEQDESNGKIDHAQKGAEMAKKILSKYNLPEEKIKNICHCIQAHRYRNNIIPETIEAKVLYDSDKLDSIGAIGTGRNFSFAGHLGAKVHDKNVNLDKSAEYTQDDTAYREYMVKLRHIKDRIITNEGKRIAEGRHKFQEKFFERLNKEVDGEI
ncbi:MAG: HD domain-containing protein [Candidatus Staskawiczbacteria bacterium]|nr:HD domain-containing protein [Candidatus Staskawiczbacteria bacterium]